MEHLTLELSNNSLYEDMNNIKYLGELMEHLPKTLINFELDLSDNFLESNNELYFLFEGFK